MMPGSGRFMQADRWGGSAWSPWKSHPFVYVNNNPMVFVDPYGLFSLNMSAAKSGFVSGFKNEIYSSLKSGVFNAVVRFASTKVPIVGQAMFVVNMIRSAQGVLQTSQLLIDLASGNISDKEISTMIGEAVGEQVAQLAMSAAKKGVSVIARKVEAAVKAKARKKAAGSGDDDGVSYKGTSIGFNTFKKLKDYLGSPGEGNHWHHIVEQSQIKKSGFSANQIHNVNNAIAVDASTHSKISGYYSSKPVWANGLRIRDWLSVFVLYFRPENQIHIMTELLVPPGLQHTKSQYLKDFQIALYNCLLIQYLYPDNFIIKLNFQVKSG
jgi:hypothetical protein